MVILAINLAIFWQLERKIGFLKYFRISAVFRKTNVETFANSLIPVCKLKMRVGYFLTVAARCSIFLCIRS